MVAEIKMGANPYLCQIIYWLKGHGIIDYLTMVRDSVDLSNILKTVRTADATTNASLLAPNNNSILRHTTC